MGNPVVAKPALLYGRVDLKSGQNGWPRKLGKVWKMDKKCRLLVRLVLELTSRGKKINRLGIGVQFPFKTPGF